MMMRARNWVVAAACVLMPVGGVAEETNMPPLSGTTSTNAWSPITSHRRNFIVTSMPHRDALEIAIWGESVVDLLRAYTGRGLPARGAGPVVIAAELRSELERGGVRAAQDFSSDGRLQQELVMVNPAVMDQEDVLERLCALLLSRMAMVMAREAGAGREVLTVPDWLAVGIAQNLYPSLRARNVATVKQAGVAGLVMSASRIFDQGMMPPGRWPEKALAGLVVGWLKEQGGRNQFIDDVLARIARKQQVRVEDVLPLLKAESVRAFDMAWDVWFFEQERRLVAGGAWSRATEGLERLVEMRVDELGLVHPDVGPGGRLTPAMLIDARRQPWAREVAKTMAFELDQTMIGMAPDLRAVAAQYGAFFKDIARAQRGAQAMSTGQLTLQWEEAARALEAFKRAESARKEMLDAYAFPVVEPAGVDVRALEEMLDSWE